MESLLYRPREPTDAIPEGQVVRIRARVFSFSGVLGPPKGTGAKVEAKGRTWAKGEGEEGGRGMDANGCNWIYNGALLSNSSQFLDTLFTTKTHIQMQEYEEILTSVAGFEPASRVSERIGPVGLCGGRGLSAPQQQGTGTSRHSNPLASTRRPRDRPGRPHAHLLHHHHPSHPPNSLPSDPAPPHPNQDLNTYNPPPPGQMEGMPYDFTWGVEDQGSGNSFSHVENSDGRTTQGEYRVLLPDGRTQVVTFYDNGDGFNAEVTYI
ncbi:uncharacterized protein [Macrobrachium rosenbergii]|uniref:uncharacterized protein n=1 Tax=Macrobrachium rosenbergii TaxID=79674 RepID=UPI0034D5A3C1